jgi:hypothetical protein
MPEPRTKATAAQVIAELYPETANEISDPAIQAVFTASLVNEVFTLAWKHQFEDDRASFQNHVRDIVRAAVEDLTSGTQST